jgi:hypothetical protein
LNYKVGILPQGLTQEVEVRIGEAVAETRMTVKAVCVQSGPHGIRIQAEFSRKGTDFPMLGMKQVTDASDLFIGNHAAPREKDSPSAPGGRSVGRRPSRTGLRRPARGGNPAPERPRLAQEPEAPSDSHREARRED